MSKFFEQSSVFNYTWEQVAQGFWKRYPNPQSLHVLSEDVISREVVNGKLITKRLLTKTNRLPKWGERFFSEKSIKIIEESVVDPQNKTLVTYTRNLGFTKVLTVVEKVVYQENDSSTTISLRSAWIDSQVYGFGRAICAFSVDRFRKNCWKMVDGFNFVLSNMFPESALRSQQHQTSSSASVPLNSAKNKIMDVAKNASDLAKSKTSPIYVQTQAN